MYVNFDFERLRSALRAQPAPPHAPNAAAVAAVLRRVEAGTEALLIRRTSHELDPWSGHMAFPGGRVHDDDHSLLFTAMRETREEVGLDLDAHATLLGALEPLDAIALGKRQGFSVTPFVFLLEGPSSLVLDSSEVAEALWAPLDALARGEHRASHTYRHAEVKREMPAFDVQGRVVWGLTHRMLVNLLDLARDP
jgi:8-oxo-dGTP pyrophosphatase MutT (NUDIX family)